MRAKIRAFCRARRSQARRSISRGQRGAVEAQRRRPIVAVVSQ
jgi:hypothetical protein